MWRVVVNQCRGKAVRSPRNASGFRITGDHGDKIERACNRQFHMGHHLRTLSKLIHQACCFQLPTNDTSFILLFFKY
jgi:hypothetical protein